MEWHDAVKKIYRRHGQLILHMNMQYYEFLRKQWMELRPVYERLMRVRTFILCWVRFKWANMPREIMNEIVSFI